jgi:ribonuclease D
LAGLLEKFCDEKIDRQMKKNMQVSEWWKRPLSEEQKNYAALDSHYLIFLR